MKIITSLIDLASFENNPLRKDFTHYVNHARELLARIPDEHDVTVFLDGADPSEIVLPRKVKFERLNLANEKLWKERLQQIEENRSRRPFHIRNEVKDTPLYGAFQQLKIEIIDEVATMAEPAEVLAWIDIGIGSAIPLESLRGRLRLDEEIAKHNEHRARLTTYGEPQLVDDFRFIRQVVAGGYIHGTARSVSAFTTEVIRHIEALHTLGFSPHDETVFENVAALRPELVECRRVDHAGHIFAL